MSSICREAPSMNKKKRYPQEGQHSADAARGGTRDRVQSQDRLKRHPNEGQ
jgi:hypothetical protein